MYLYAILYDIYYSRVAEGSLADMSERMSKERTRAHDINVKFIISDFDMNENLKGGPMMDLLTYSDLLEKAK